MSSDAGKGVEGGGEGEAMPELIDATGDNRPSAYRENDRWVMRASSFGGCDTRLAREAIGMPGLPPPIAIQAAFQFGHDAEPILIRKLEADTPWRMLKPGEMRQWGKVGRNGQLSLELTGPGFVVRCHPDGVVRHEGTGELRVLEVKTRAEKSSDPEGDAKYKWQFSIERAVTKLDVLLVVGWKVPEVDENGAITGERMLKDGPLDVREIDVVYTTADIKRRALGLRKMFDAAWEAKECEVACSVADWPCPYHNLCGGGAKEVEVAAPVATKDRARVEELAVEFSEAKREQGNAKKRYDAARKELAKVLGEQGKWEVGEWEVKITTTDIKPSVVERKGYKQTTVTVGRKDEVE